MPRVFYKQNKNSSGLVLRPVKRQRHEEHDIQKKVVIWLSQFYPKALYTISPTGLVNSKAFGSKAKALGYRKGTPDIMILEPKGGFNGLLIELKKDNGVLSIDQRQFLEEADARGYKTKVCYGFEAAKDGIRTYLDLR